MIMNIISSATYSEIKVGDLFSQKYSADNIAVYIKTEPFTGSDGKTYNAVMLRTGAPKAFRDDCYVSNVAEITIKV